MSEKQDEEINEMLRHVKQSQLKAFTAQYAYRHPAFKKDILKQFNPKQQGKTLAAYRDIVSAVFSFEPRGRYSRDYNFYQAASEAAHELLSLLDKAEYFISKNNFEEAASITQSVIEAIPRNYEMVDDSDGDLGDTFNHAVDLLLQIAENESGGVELKKEIFNWVAKEVKENIYGDYGFDEIHSLLIPYTRAAGLHEEALMIADERITLAANRNNYGLESAVNDKIRLLQQSNRTDEAEGVINEYIDFVSVRKMRLGKMLEHKQYKEAIQLIEAGIAIAEKEKHPGTVADWKDQLLELYMQMQDNKNILKYAEDLFYNGARPINYYHILKTEKDSKDWPAYLDMLLSKPAEAGWYGLGSNLLSQIYIEEKYWDRLLQLAEKSELNQITSLEEYLKPRFPEQLRDMLINKIKVYAARNVGRSYYQYVAEILKKIRTYPRGNEEVDKLLAEFRIKYKARTAMMKELKGV